MSELAMSWGDGLVGGIGRPGGPVNRCPLNRGLTGGINGGGLFQGVWGFVWWSVGEDGFC